MPKGYVVTCYHSITDPERLQAYAKLATPAIAAAGGRFIARGTAAKVMEAGIKERTVIIEFDTLEQAMALYDSPAYQDAVKALGNAAKRDMRVVEGT